MLTVHALQNLFHHRSSMRTVQLPEEVDIGDAAVKVICFTFTSYSHVLEYVHHLLLSLYSYYDGCLSRIAVYLFSSQLIAF